jgi:hypothetical protein
VTSQKAGSPVSGPVTGWGSVGVTVPLLFIEAESTLTCARCRLARR